MTNRLILGCLVVLFASMDVGAAECMHDIDGHVVCGQGQCARDPYGKVYCARAGGGAMTDQYGAVKCGTGYCTRDEWGQVFCSRTPGGAATVDTWGKPKCLGACEPARQDLCEAPR